MYMTSRQGLLLTLYTLWQSVWPEEPEELPLQQQAEPKEHTVGLQSSSSIANEAYETVLKPIILCYTHCHSGSQVAPLSSSEAAWRHAVQLLQTHHFLVPLVTKVGDKQLKEEGLQFLQILAGDANTRST